MARLAQIITTNDTLRSQPQTVEYSRGMGARRAQLDRLGGGVFGWGIDADIEKAYPEAAALHDSVFKRWPTPTAAYRPSHLPLYTGGAA